MSTPVINGSDWRDRLPSWPGVRTALFGDRLGVALFLGTLCWFGLTWRIGFFITDTYAVANTLVNVASGHLYVEHVEYSLTLGSSQPGLYVEGGQVFGRNYGQVYLTLPIYFLYQGLSTLVDLRVALTGGVSLALLGVAHQVGVVLDRRAGAVVAGSALALVTFLYGLATAHAIDPRWAGLLALQTTTALAGAVLAVALYRLLGSIYDRRLGLAVGLVAVVASPIGFWATLPKRHVLTAALATVTVAVFYASRTRSDRVGRLARAGAYAAAGFTAAVHAGEGAVLVGLLVPIDLLTAPSNGRRDLGIAAAGLAVGLAPFLLTNALISSNPLVAPRWLPSFSGGSIGPGGVVQMPGEPSEPVSTITSVVQPTPTPTPGTGTVTTPGGSSNVTTVDPTSPPTGGDSGPSILESVLAAGASVLRGLGAIVDRVGSSLATVTEADRLYHVFVRSGRIPSVSYRLNDNAVIELTMLESMPVGGAALAVGGVAGSRLRSWLAAPGRALSGGLQAIRTDPRRGTDLLALAYVGALTVAYLPRLPLFSQITVRYLVPTVPLWLYLLARIGPVARAVSARSRWIARGYAVGVLAVGCVSVGLLAMLDPALGEAVQFHALVHLGLAGLTAVAVPVGSVTERPQIGAFALGVTAAATTVFLVLAGLVYFPYGPAVLPVSSLLADLLALV